MYKLYAYWSYPKPEDVEAFEDHYLNVHVPKAAAVPGLRRIVMTHTAAGGFEGDQSKHYRVAEMVWDSKEALEECEQSEAWTTVRADSGAMIERFGVTLEVEMGEEVLGDIPGA